MSRAVLLGVCMWFAVVPVSADPVVQLNPGLNLVSFTTEPDPPLTSHQMGGVIGPSLNSIGRIDSGGTVNETTFFSDEGPQGPDFLIVPGEGYVVDMATQADVVLEGAVAAAVEVDLAKGLNLVGFHPVGAVFRAFDVLRRLGGPDVVASVARFNPNNGRFETAAQTSAGPSGKNFIVRAGDGLLISMHQPVVAFSVPGVGFGMLGEHFVLLRSVLSGGGGTVSAEDGMTIHSVIGQPTPIGISASAHYRLSGGFLGQ